MIITTEFLDKYFKHNFKHGNYEYSVNAANELKVHFDGKFPEKLIGNRRPNESEYSFQYRKEIYQHKTKSICSKILTSLNKIRRSPDWSVKFNTPSYSIPEKETPEQYLNYNFPIFTSVTNWIFSVVLKKYLIDANAVCCVIPIEPIVDGEFMRPMSFIFDSKYVIDFKENEFAVLESKDKCSYTHNGQSYHNGRVIYIVTDLQVVKYQQTSTDGTLSLSSEYAHGLGYMPAFKLRGIYKDVVNGNAIWESRIAGILPDLNEFVRMYSDFQAQVVQHVFSEKWMWGANDECETCNGTGYNPSNVKAVCHTCNGTKKKKISQFGITNVKPTNTNLGQSPSPIPPLGYISKESVAEMTTLLDTLLDKAEVKALSSINMEFLAKVPMVESGIAKTIDRDEANNFVHSIAEDLVWILDEVCRIIIDYRYSFINPMARAELRPIVTVPESFDLLNTNALLAEMQAAQTAKMNTSYLNKLQIEISQKKYSEDDSFIKIMTCATELNPLPTTPIQDVILMAQSKYITEVDAVIACNIESFVTTALNENPEFDSLPYKDKIAKMKEYAMVKINENKVEIEMPIE